MGFNSRVLILTLPVLAAAAAKSLQSCLTVWPHRRQPTRPCRPWDSPGKNTGVSCHFLLQCMKVKSESEVAQSCLLLATPWTAAYQAPPSMGFSRQETIYETLWLVLIMQWTMLASAFVKHASFWKKNLGKFLEFGPILLPHSIILGNLFVLHLLHL